MRKLKLNQMHAIFAPIALLFALVLPVPVWAEAPIAIQQPQVQAESAGGAIPVRHRLAVHTADLFAMQAGDSFSISVPGHTTPFELVYDRTDNASPQFAPSWIGHLKGYADDYRAIVTSSGDHSVGRIATPEGNFIIETQNGVTTLFDAKRAGAKPGLFGNDALHLPVPAQASAMSSMRAGATVNTNDSAPAGNTTVDVLALYNPGFQTATGNAQNTIAGLIATANTAMVDSGVPITFRLVATQSLALSDTDSNDQVLSKVTYPSFKVFQAANPQQPDDTSLTFDPVYSGVPALRDQYGADLVVSVREFNAAHQTCGIAWTLTNIAQGKNAAQDAYNQAFDDAYAYAVVSYGSYNPAPNEIITCDQVTMAHEMGHNLGSAHDRAHASMDQNGNPIPGAFSYSFGYGFPGASGFATVMAANYIEGAPVVAKYSSPSLTCLGSPCGVAPTAPLAADNALSLTNMAARTALFRPTAALIYTPATGYWWNPVEPGRGYNIEKSGNNLFMAAFLYDPSGRTTWYGVGPGAMVANTFTGTLETYSGGQTLTGAFKAAGAGPSAGAFSITFSSATTATLTWPGGNVPIQRYDFGPGGSGAAQPAGNPQSGWWWAPTEGGRGYAIEIQGGSMFLAGYMYDASGNPVWYASGPTPMTNTLSYVGQWEQFGNGQTLTGTYKPAAVINATAGNVSIQFSSTTAGTLTFPDGRQVAIQRFPF